MSGFKVVGCRVRVKGLGLRVLGDPTSSRIAVVCSCTDGLLLGVLLLVCTM